MNIHESFFDCLNKVIKISNYIFGNMIFIQALCFFMQYSKLLRGVSERRQRKWAFQKGRTREIETSASDETITEVFSSEEIWTEEPLTDETLVEEDTMVESTTEEVTEEDVTSTEESTEQSIYETDDFTVIFKLDSAWDGGYNALVRIEILGMM